MKARFVHYKACPLCGSYDLAPQESEDVDDSVLHAIWCRACDAAGPLVAGEAGRAWAAWDLRTEIRRDWLDPACRGTDYRRLEDVHRETWRARVPSATIGN